jgi:hypothetical protein
MSGRLHKLADELSTSCLARRWQPCCQPINNIVLSTYHVSGLYNIPVDFARTIGQTHAGE